MIADIFQRGLLAAACVVVLGGCLPEDTYLALQFSPDGQLLALVSEKQGLIVADPGGMEMRQLTGGLVDSSNIAWTTDSLRVAYAGAFDASLDIYITSLDGYTARMTASPSRETNPMIQEDTLIYLSTVSGISELTTQSLSGEDTVSTLSLPEVGRHLLTPVLSPDLRYIAAFGFENMRPQIYCIDTYDGSLEQITSETDVFSLVAGSIAWSPDSKGIGFLRDGLINSGYPDDDERQIFAGSGVAAGSSFNLRSLENPDTERTLVRQPDGIRSARFDKKGNLIFSSGRNLMLSPLDGPVSVLPLDLPAALPVPGGDDGEIAFIAANQLIGITTSSMERARLLTFDLEDKFFLAEEYFRSGSRSKSYDVYEELRASVQRTRDPEMARFVYIANLRRLGRTDEAVAEVEKLLTGENYRGSVPEQYLWRLLGFSYLLELNDLEQAARSLERYAQLTSGSEEQNREDSALNALTIIMQTSAPVVQLYAQAVKARLDGDFAQTDRLFGELLTTAPHSLAVQQEYMNALNGFDYHVYYFSPSQRPFKPTRSQRADYLERLVQVVPDSPLARNARLDLFLLRIEMGSYSRARALLAEAMDSETDGARPDGILEVFHNFLEIPEPQPWINQAMPEVFLHSEIRPRLEALIQAPEDRLLMAVSAAKVALLQVSPDRARREADTALAEWNRIPAEQQVGDVAAIYGRLLIMRAREAELRGLYSEASEAYEHAAKVLAEKQVDVFEMQEEIHYRAALLRTLLADHPEIAARFQDIELRTGIELINPTWESDSIKSAIQDYVELYDSTSSTLRQWCSYEAGVLFGKLKRHHQARAALLIAASDSGPEFLRRKVMLELAAIDEYDNDPWNAARWYSRLAAFPGTTADVRMWCSYQIARLHLSINYKISAAREALALIVSNRPGTPLAIQAQELLMATSTR